MGAKSSKTIFNPFILIVLVVIFATLFYILTENKSPMASVIFYDVGQGDSALVSTPAGQNVLIDGGPGDSISSKIDKDIPFYKRKIDAIILTHPHADHLDGLIQVIKNYQVNDVYMTGILQTTPEYLEFLQTLKDKNIATHSVIAGNSLDFGDGIKMDFLFPLTNLSGQRIDNLNNSSIVSRLRWGKSSILFTGDIEKEAQDSLLATNPDLKALVLKVPHHGSKDSANPNFISAVSPKYAVISVGKDNKFGHPAPSHLDVLKGISIYRTDEDGSVKFQFNQNTLAPANN